MRKLLEQNALLAPTPLHIMYMHVCRHTYYAR